MVVNAGVARRDLRTHHLGVCAQVVSDKADRCLGTTVAFGVHATLGYGQEVGEDQAHSFKNIRIKRAPRRDSLAVGLGYPRHG